MIKSKEQMKFEAMKRKQVLEAKSKNNAFNKAGNVKTSFGKCNKEYLINMGFYVKGERNKPSKSAWVEKRLDKNIIEVDLRKKSC
jgi:hypothetical protein